MSYSSTMNLKQHKARPNLRRFLFVSSIAQGLGIYLSGYDQVHWFLYIPPIMFLGAALNGYCSMLIIIEKIFGIDSDKACDRT